MSGRIATSGDSPGLLYRCARRAFAYHPPEALNSATLRQCSLSSGLVSYQLRLLAAPRGGVEPKNVGKQYSAIVEATRKGGSKER